MIAMQSEKDLSCCKGPVIHPRAQPLFGHAPAGETPFRVEGCSAGKVAPCPDIPYSPSMTATEIIREIDALPPAELAEVVRHTKKLDQCRPLSGAELTELARRMVEASDPAEADRLREALVKGFYGDAD
jgi:hypothetical protein